METKHKYELYILRDIKIIDLLSTIHHFNLRLFKLLDPPRTFICFLRKVPQLKERPEAVPSVEISKQ